MLRTFVAVSGPPEDGHREYDTKTRAVPVMGGDLHIVLGLPVRRGWAAYITEQLGQHRDPISWAGYLAAPEFWNWTFQNWQSEMLAVGAMAVLSVFLRQRGSPEFKPVGAAHDDTGQTG
jgi:hypothetical protein